MSERDFKQKIIEKISHCLQLNEIDGRRIAEVLLDEGRKGLEYYTMCFSDKGTFNKLMNKKGSDLLTILNEYFEKKLSKIDEKLVDEEKLHSPELYEKILRQIAEGFWQIPKINPRLWLVLRFFWPFDKSNKKYDEYETKLISEGLNGLPAEIESRDVISGVLEEFYRGELAKNFFKNTSMATFVDQLPMKCLVENGWWIGVHQDEFRSKIDEKEFEKLLEKLAEFKRDLPKEKPREILIEPVVETKNDENWIDEFLQIEQKWTPTSWNKFERFTEFQAGKDRKSKIESLLQLFVYFLKRGENLQQFCSFIENDDQISFRMLIDFLLVRCDSKLRRRILSSIIKTNPVPFDQPEIFDLVEKSSSIFLLSFSFVRCQEKSSLLNGIFKTNFEKSKQNRYFRTTIDVQPTEFFRSNRRIFLADCHGEMTENLLEKISSHFDGFLVHLTENEQENRHDILQKFENRWIFIRDVPKIRVSFSSTREFLLPKLNEIPAKNFDEIREKILCEIREKPLVKQKEIEPLTTADWRRKIESMRFDLFSIGKIDEKNFSDWIRSGFPFEIDFDDDQQLSFLFRTFLSSENFPIFVVTIVGRTRQDQIDFFNSTFATTFDSNPSTSRFVGVLKNFNDKFLLFIVANENENRFFSLCLSNLLVVLSDSDEDLKSSNEILRHLDVSRLAPPKILHAKPIFSGFQTRQIDFDYFREKDILCEKLLRLIFDEPPKTTFNILQWLFMSIDVVHCFRISGDVFLCHDEHDKKIFETIFQCLQENLLDPIDDLSNKEIFFAKLKRQFEEKTRLSKISKEMRNYAEKIFYDETESFFDDFRQRKDLLNDKNWANEFHRSTSSKSIGEFLHERKNEFAEKYSEEKFWTNSLKFASNFYRIFQNDFFFDEKIFQKNFNANWPTFFLQRAFRHSPVVLDHDETIEEKDFSIEILRNFQHLNRSALIDRFFSFYAENQFASKSFQNQFWNYFLSASVDSQNQVKRVRIYSSEKFQIDIRNSIDQQRPIILSNVEINDSQLILPLSPILTKVKNKSNEIINNSSTQDFCLEIVIFIDKLIDEINDELKIFSLKLSKAFRLVLHEIPVYFLSKKLQSEKMNHLNELLFDLERNQANLDESLTSAMPNQYGENVIRRWIQLLVQHFEKETSKIILEHFQQRTDLNRQYFQTTFEEKLFRENQIDEYVKYLRDPIAQIEKSFREVWPSDKKERDRKITAYRNKYRKMIRLLFEYLQDLIKVFHRVSSPKENLHRILTIETNDSSTLTSHLAEKQRALIILFRQCLIKEEISTVLVVDETNFRLNEDFRHELQKLIAKRQIDPILVEIIKNDDQQVFIENLPEEENFFQENFHPKPSDDEAEKHFEIFLRKSIGCRQVCPFCHRLCDVEHRKPADRHACRSGHQLRIFAGFLVELTGEPSLLTCDEIIDFHRTKANGEDFRWNEWKHFQSDWDFHSTINLIEQKEKMKRIWSLVGRKISSIFSTNFVLINTPLIHVDKSFHFYLIFENPKSMSVENWAKTLHHFQDLINNRARIHQRDLFTGIFYTKFTSTENFRVHFRPLANREELQRCREESFDSTTRNSSADKIPVLLYDHNGRNFDAKNFENFIQKIRDAIQNENSLKNQFDRIDNAAVLDLSQSSVFVQSYAEKKLRGEKHHSTLIFS